MTDDEPSGDAKARLERLAARIDAAKASDGGQGTPHTETHYSQANLAWRMVTELVAGLLIGLFIGLGLDTLLGTSPFLMVVFLGLGLAAGIRVMMRTAAEVGQRAPTGAPDAPEMGAPQTGAPETGAPTTGAAKTGARKTSTADPAATSDETSAPDGGADRKR